LFDLNIVSNLGLSKLLVSILGICSVDYCM